MRLVWILIVHSAQFDRAAEYHTEQVAFGTSQTEYDADYTNANFPDFTTPITQTQFSPLHLEESNEPFFDSLFGSQKFTSGETLPLINYADQLYQDYNINGYYNVNLPFAGPGALSDDPLTAYDDEITQAPALALAHAEDSQFLLPDTIAEEVAGTSAQHTSVAELNQRTLQEITNSPTEVTHTLPSVSEAAVTIHRPTIRIEPPTAPQAAAKDKENVSAPPRVFQQSTAKRRYNQIDDSAGSLMGGSSSGNGSSNVSPIMALVLEAKRQRTQWYISPQIPAFWADQAGHGVCVPPVVQTPTVTHVPNDAHVPNVAHKAPATARVPQPRARRNRASPAVAHSHAAFEATKVIVHPLPRYAHLPLAFITFTDLRLHLRTRFPWGFQLDHTCKDGLVATNVINESTYTIDPKDIRTWGAESRPSVSTTSSVDPLPTVENIDMVCLLCNKVFSSKTERARSLNSHFNNVHCNKPGDPCYAISCNTAHPRNGKQNNLRRRHLLGSSVNNSHKVKPSATCQEEIAMGLLKEDVDLTSGYVQNILEEVTEQYLQKIETGRWVRKWIEKLTEKRKEQTQA